MWRFSAIAIALLAYVAVSGAVNHFITGTTAIDTIAINYIPLSASLLALVVLAIVPFK